MTVKNGIVIRILLNYEKIFFKIAYTEPLKNHAYNVLLEGIHTVTLVPRPVRRYYSREKGYFRSCISPVYYCY